MTTPLPPISTRCGRRLRTELLASDAETTSRLLAGLSRIELKFLISEWSVWARDDQLAPPGDWTVWLALGGRGAGKTRAGAEWVRDAVHGRAGFANAPARRVALVAETYADLREVMIDCVSGLRAVCPPWERPLYEPSRRRLVWPTGALAQGFSARDP